jgi:lipopolysaccharide/colanic/teichoic acid biosynthesis glycosyltransferase
MRWNTTTDALVAKCRSGPAHRLLASSGTIRFLMEGSMRLDPSYVEARSFMHDPMILSRTVWAVFAIEGAC